jgi:hypothetical protein
MAPITPVTGTHLKNAHVNRPLWHARVCAGLANQAPGSWGRFWLGFLEMDTICTRRGSVDADFM